MKLLIVLSVLSVLALVAAKPVELEETSRTNNDYVLLRGTVTASWTTTWTWRFDEKYTITRFNVQQVAGNSIFYHLNGGVGYNHIALMFFQPPFDNTQYIYNYEIWGIDSVLNSSSEIESEIIAGSHVKVDVI